MTDGDLVFAVATRFEQNVVESGRSMLLQPALRKRSTVVSTGIGFSDCNALDELQNVACVVSTGFAAGLQPRLRPGALLVPESVIGGDTRATPLSSYWHGRIRRALDDHFDLVTGPLLHVTEIMSEPHAKDAAYRKYRAAGADMESLRIAEYCAERNLPFAALRVVLDPANAAMPESVVAVTDKGQPPRLLPLLLQLFRRPGDWSAFASMLGYTASARKSLRRAIELAAPAIADHADRP